MNTLYIKTTDSERQISYHSTQTYRISMLAEHYQHLTQERLWKIESEYLEVQVISKFSYLGTFIDKIQAYLLGKELQPDREIDTPLGKYNFSFDNILPLTLGESKSIKKNQIDLKTQQIIYKGYNYSGITGSTLFSLSQNAQIDFASHRIAYESGKFSRESAISIKLTTIKDEEFTLPTEEIPKFTDGAYNIIASTLNSGRSIKVTINNCSTILDVNSVSDSR